MKKSNTNNKLTVKYNELLNEILSLVKEVKVDDNPIKVKVKL